MVFFPCGCEQFQLHKLNKNKMDYKEKLKLITTLEELLDFRELLSKSFYEFKAIGNEYEASNAAFYNRITGLQIRQLIKNGHNLTSIETKPLQRTFSINEIEALQTKVHAITGDGEVMELFNELK